MTNYEKNKDIIEEMLLTKGYVIFGLDMDTSDMIECGPQNCRMCKFSEDRSKSCDNLRRYWLNDDAKGNLFSLDGKGKYYIKGAYVYNAENDEVYCHVDLLDYFTMEELT